MKSLKQFGLWAESPWAGSNGGKFPSVYDQPRGVLSESEASRLAAYLDECPIFAASPGIVFSEGDVAGTGSIVTDGEWGWEDTMSYYVRKYRISPPLDFVQKVRSRNFVPPMEGDIDFSAISFFLFDVNASDK